MQFNKFIPMLITLTTMNAVAQISMPLYEGTIPNNIPGVVSNEQIVSGGTKFILHITHPEIYVYLPDKKINTGKAVIICPGGGYSGLAIDHEGHAIAKKLQANGITGIVLKNRVPDPINNIDKSIAPLQDAQRAIQLVRQRAATWSINPNKLGILGSSAGGHLASTAATHFKNAVIDNPGQINLRPDFAILNYPVISFADSITHKGSRDNLIKKNGVLDPEQVKLYSNELQVTDQTPPVFITHALDDQVVPIANSIVFIAACDQHKVPVTSFFYTRGGHGFGMLNPAAEKQWIDDCLQWIKSLK